MAINLVKPLSAVALQCDNSETMAVSVSHSSGRWGTLGPLQVDYDFLRLVV
jgi:hypothetical protein